MAKLTSITSRCSAGCGATETSRAPFQEPETFVSVLRDPPNGRRLTLTFCPSCAMDDAIVNRVFALWALRLA